MLVRHVLWLAGLVALLLAPAILPAWTSAAGSSQAALVIQFSDGRVETRCVSFEEEQVTGADLLIRSGLDVLMDTASSMGVTVCRIEDEGCDFPAKPCFCQCMGGEGCAYWNYFYRDPGQTEWIYSPLGAAVRKVPPRSVEAWVWGDGQTPPAGELSFEAICLPPTPTSTSTPRPATSVPATALPRETLAPTQTPTEPPTATVPLPSPTPSPAVEPDPSLSSYWPFGLMLLGLAFAGALVWLRRT